MNIPGVKNEGKLIFLARNVITNDPKRCFRQKSEKTVFSDNHVHKLRDNFEF